MNIYKIISIFLISSLLFSCATYAPRAIEDSDDGPVLIIEAENIIKTVENWGLKNGFQYVAYRRIGTGTSSEWAAAANQYGAYGSSRTVYYSRVLVVGINDLNEVPDKFNVLTVPETLNTYMTETGAYLLGFGIGTVLGLIILIPIMNMD
jgi:hypothetical protein